MRSRALFSESTHASRLPDGRIAGEFAPSGDSIRKKTLEEPGKRRKEKEKEEKEVHASVLPWILVTIPDIPASHLVHLEHLIHNTHITCYMCI